MSEGNRNTPPEIRAAADPRETEPTADQLELIRHTKDELIEYLAEHTPEMDKDTRDELAQEAARDLVLDPVSFDARANIAPILREFENMYNPHLRRHEEERAAGWLTKLFKKNKDE